MNDLKHYLEEDDDEYSPLGDAILRDILNLPPDFDFNDLEENDEDTDVQIHDGEAGIGYIKSDNFGHLSKPGLIDDNSPNDCFKYEEKKGGNLKDDKK